MGTIIIHFMWFLTFVLPPAPKERCVANIYKYIETALL